MDLVIFTDFRHSIKIYSQYLFHAKEAANIRYLLQGLIHHKLKHYFTHSIHLTG